MLEVVDEVGVSAAIHDHGRDEGQLRPHRVRVVSVIG